MNIYTEYYLAHHGIKGQKWGVRRYRNEDGTLTEEGRQHLGLDEYEKDHNVDLKLKKGTKASRVISTSRYDEYADPKFGGSEQRAKKYVKDTIDKDDKLKQTYISVDGVRNSGRENGKDFYVSWFTAEGYEPDHAVIASYTLKKDAKVASGKKVVDALLEEIGDEKLNDVLENGGNLDTLTLEYTNNQDLFNRVNKRFIDKGYDAIEDINDPDTDMPLIVLNAPEVLSRSSTIQTGMDALKKMGFVYV